MSSSGQHQFRYTQTPSKVLHLRNLPWECSEEELVELCRPFGKIVNTKCNVGANRNQAFVEYADLNQAISMVSYFASASEPAQVRGKTVYIQYSNRHEIVNNKSPGDIPGNVLLVTMEGVQPGDVTIEVIHLAAGFQALIQFSDVDTASAAKDALDGRSIPKYLLPEHVSSCNLRISYSAHTDLNIKFQSHRSRDYTNPYLPVNPTAFEGLAQPVVGADGVKKDQESNVLLAAIENMQYAVTVDVLHTVFSAFGTVQKIAIFEKNGQKQALIQYPVDMEEDQSGAVTSSSLADVPVLDDAEAIKSLPAEKCCGGSLSDDEIWLTDCDEEADEAFYLNREGRKRHEEFYNVGYRDGLSAGKNDAAQDGFNLGFKDSVMIGYRWGISRGVTSALAHIPDELKLKLVETEERRREFQNLYEAVDSIGTEDALKMFNDDIQRGKSMKSKKIVESHSSISHLSGSKHSDLESYFKRLDLLLKESLGEVNRNRL